MSAAGSKAQESELPINLSTWLGYHAIAASLIVLSCSTSVRLLFAWRSDGGELVRIIPDASTYIGPAFNLVNTGVFTDGQGKPEIARTPGYPAFVAGLILLAGPDLGRVLLLQAALLSGSTVVLYWLARRILPPVMAFAGGIISAFSPWGGVMPGLPLSDGLFVWLLAVILFLMKLISEARPVPAILMAMCLGLVTGMAVLVRPFWPLILMIAFATFTLYGLKRRGAWLVLVVSLVFSSAPPAFWRERNQREAQFAGLSDIPGKTVWRYLAARVKAEATDQNHHEVSALAYKEESQWNVTLQQADDERWRRAKGVFKEYPFLTVYSFARSATEHAIHPSPDVLAYAKLNFNGDYFVLASLWGGLLALALFGWISIFRLHQDDGEIDRRWLVTVLLICLALTLSSGVSFAAGSRLRAPLELIVPLLAGAGLVRLVSALRRATFRTHEI